MLSCSQHVQVACVTERARAAIEGAGGKVHKVYYNQLGMRAMLLPEWFAKKGRLVPRAVQMVPYKKQWRYDRVGTIPATEAAASVA
jgi:large subunit ribosomal protein L15